MERILKTACVLMAAFFVAITVDSVLEKDLYGGGGINYTITVYNSTKSKCRANPNAGAKQQGRQTIQAGQAYTWSTGALCPEAIWGEYWDSKYSKWRKMQCVNPYGHRIDCGSGLGQVVVCKSVRFQVCRKAGEGFEEVRDYDMGFCKY